MKILERIGLALAAVLFVLLVVSLALTANEPKDFIVPTIAVLAIIVSLMAWAQSRKSATAAETSASVATKQEERGRYGWRVEVNPSGKNYVLRNIGTVPAREVQLHGDFYALDFDLEVDEPGGPSIPRGEARAFHALEAMGDRGTEVVISWIPDGVDDDTRREWREVLPRLPDTFKDYVEKSEAKRERAREHAREDAKHHLEIMLRLGDAWSAYKADPTDPAAKLKVQLLVAALPPAFAREMGYAVDVARDVWGPGEYPFSNHFAPEDWPLIEPVVAEVELMWNIRQLKGYRVYSAIGADGIEEEPRVWWGMRGYVDRLKQRESGDERPTRRNPFDQRHYEEARRRFDEMDRERAGDSEVIEIPAGEPIENDPTNVAVELDEPPNEAGTSQ